MTKWGVRVSVTCAWCKVPRLYTPSSAKGRKFCSQTCNQRGRIRVHRQKPKFPDDIEDMFTKLMSESTELIEEGLGIK